MMGFLGFFMATFTIADMSKVGGLILLVLSIVKAVYDVINKHLEMQQNLDNKNNNDENETSN